MGKRIIQQARGRGGPTYRAPSFRYKGEAKHPYDLKEDKLVVEDIVHCPGHNAPLLKTKSLTTDKGYLFVAPEGVSVGQQIFVGTKTNVDVGNIMQLKDIPEGTTVFNIEKRPGDGGKFVRSSGGSARVVSQTEDTVVVRLPSKKTLSLNPKCRATIGIVSGGGRTDKPLLKAGNSFFKKKAKNKLWPVVSGASMNAVDHPFGNSRSLRKAKAKPVSKHAPPGRKVGMVGARRTGRRK